MKKGWIRYFILFAALLLAGFYGYNIYPQARLPDDAFIDKMIVLKSERKLCVYSNEKLLKVYRISLGGNPRGTKQFEGDQRTPEGIYHIAGKNPNSTCYKNLGISYPDADDRKSAELAGKPTGGDIKIHGLLNGLGFIGRWHIFSDWTAGCIAVTNEQMDELYTHTPVGASIEIRP